MNVFYDDFPGSGGAPPGVEVLQGGQRCPGGTLSIVDHFVESFPVHIGAATVPGGGAPSVHRLNCCGIKGPLQLWRS